MHLPVQSRVTASGPHVCAVCLKPTWNRPSTSFGIVCRHICTKNDTNFTFLNTNCSVIGTTLRSCHCWSFLCLCWLHVVSDRLIYGSIQIESVFGPLFFCCCFIFLFYLNFQVSGLQHFRFRQVCFGFQISLIGTNVKRHRENWKKQLKSDLRSASAETVRAFWFSNHIFKSDFK